MGHYLCIDTAISGAFVGILERVDSEVREVAVKHFQPMFGSSSALPAMVHTLQSEANIEKFAGILLSTGPGSFTGIKVGIAFSKGYLAEVSGGAILPVNMLAACGEQLAKEQNLSRLSLVLPATRTHGFAVDILEGKLTRCEVVERSDDDVLSAKSDSFVFENPVMMTAWPKRDEFGSTLDTSELTSLIMRAMKATLPSNSDSSFVEISDIQPVYIREPAPVERKGERS